MTAEEFIDWLGELYLDFQNESEEYCDITRKEIREKLKLLNNRTMTHEEFNKRLDILLSDDEISDKEIKTNINNMVEALLKSKVEAISDNIIAEKINSDKNLSPFYGSSFRIVKWFKEQLLKQ